jgi:nucleotide-binding universal stress UspA family protein
VAKVLLATDGSRLATAAAHRAVALMGHDHDFTALVVVPPPTAAAPIGEAGVAPIIDPVVASQQTEALTDEAGTILDGLAAELAVPIRHRVERGEPGHTICEVAAEEGVDVVVVGSHGTGFLKRLLLGSVSHHVLHHASRPVLVVREDRDG